MRIQAVAGKLSPVLQELLCMKGMTSEIDPLLEPALSRRRLTCLVRV